MEHAGWLKPIHDPAELRKVTNLIVAEVSKMDPKPVFVAVRGTSGTVIGGTVSLVSDIPLVVVRKNDDSSHAMGYGSVQGISDADGPYVIVDDLVDTGDTVRQIIRAVSTRTTRSECIAVILYSERQLQTESINVDGNPIPLITPNLKLITPNPKRS